MLSPDQQRLVRIWDYCRFIQGTVSRFGGSWEAFSSDSDYQQSVAFSVLQIGELARRLSDELRQEGMAREIINRVQNIRKDSGLEIVDRIHITLAPNAEIEAAVNSYGDYIKTQVLADDITIAPNDGTEVEFDEFKININITKA